ncbi:type II toxin-antitoxin system RelE/ParE family toxin [Desulfococcaceae bacterium HSG9]|nr:type II toxin-antitoxin system RelE/ParE family toxin [Desulfococcaceae bacterium HSG9]
MLKLDLTKKALTFLDKLPPKQFKQVSNKIFSLMKNPEPHDSKELKGYPYRGTDIGEYRIIYRVEEGVLKIALVGKRNDSAVYKKLTRL